MLTLPVSGERQRRTGRPFQYRLRTLSLAVVVVAVLLGLMLNPDTGPLVVGAILVPVFGAGLLLVAALLGALGVGLFAVGSSATRWLIRAGQWTEPDNGWDVTNNG